MVQPTVTEDGKKSPGLKFGQPRVMALFLALTLFHHLIDGFRNAFPSPSLMIATVGLVAASQYSDVALELTN